MIHSLSVERSASEPIAQIRGMPTSPEQTAHQPTSHKPTLNSGKNLIPSRLEQVTDLSATLPPAPNNPRDISEIKAWVKQKNAHIQPQRLGGWWFINKENYFHPNEVKKHNKMTDGWIVMKDGRIFDVTYLFLYFNHVGLPPLRSPALDHSGECSTLKKRIIGLLGQTQRSFNTGKDEFDWHSPSAKKYWEAMHIGSLERI